MLKKLLPHLYAVGVFAVLAMAYFMPYYQGKVLNQHDVSQWNAMAKELIDYREQGEEVLWTSRMFSGMPGFQISTIYPANWLSPVNKVLQAVFPEAVSAFFLMLLGFYLLLMAFEVELWLAVAGAIGFAFGSFNLISIEAGHNTKVMNMALIAPILAGVVQAYRGRLLAGGAIVAFFFGLAMLSGHYQVVYYTFIMAGVFALCFLAITIKEKTWALFAKASAVLLVAVVIGFLPNFSAFWSTLEYSKETIRGGGSELTTKKSNTDGGLEMDYATQYSIGSTDMEWLTTIIPAAKGGASGESVGTGSASYKALLSNGVPEEQAKGYCERLPLYWGEQPGTSGPPYFGAVVFFLFVLGSITVKSPWRYVLWAITLLAYFLAFGKHSPVYGWLFNLLPYFNKFRTPSMAFVMANLAMPLLGIMALNELFKSKDAGESRKSIKLAGYLSLGAVAGLWLISHLSFSYVGVNDIQFKDQLPDWLMKAIREDRATNFRNDAIRSLIFIGVALSVLWAFTQRKLKLNAVVGILIALTLVDEWMVDKRYLNDDDFVEKNEYQSNFAPSNADLEILKDTDPNYRVFDVTGNPFANATPSYYHKHIGGYHAAKLIRYQDLIENQISKNNMQVLNMLNTRYFIVKGQNGPQAQRNPGALGNAWFVQNVQWVKNADEEMKALDNFTPQVTAVVDERFKQLAANVASADSSSTIRLLSFKPNDLVYQYQSSTDNQLAVFSEVYYDKGWNCYVDGKKHDYLRCNYVLRAAVLPAGSHKVEWKFEPHTYYDGEKVSLAGSVLLWLLVGGALVLAVKNNLQQSVAKAGTVTTPTSAKKK